MGIEIYCLLDDNCRNQEDGCLCTLPIMECEWQNVVKVFKDLRLGLYTTTSPPKNEGDQA